jgi:hypothetical protein
MKNLIACMAFFFTLIGSSQVVTDSDGSKMEITKLENFAVTVTVNSSEDLKSTIQLKTLKKLLAHSAEDQSISFKLICESETSSAETNSSVSYKVKGNSSEPEAFLETVEKIINAGIKYYDNKD